MLVTDNSHRGYLQQALLIISLITLLGCEEIDRDCPDCILKKTREFVKRPICDTGASVTEWLFQGVYVYVFDEGDCGADIGVSVFNQNCEFLAYLGDFAGITNINGVEFYPNATKTKVIWKQV